MTNANMHFEELWEKCENFYKEAGNDNLVESIVDELAYKLTLYKALESKTEIPDEERTKAKSRLMGEILLTLTNLSLKDNINVFDALGVALQHRSIGYYSKKHSD